MDGWIKRKQTKSNIMENDYLSCPLHMFSVYITHPLEFFFFLYYTGTGKYHVSPSMYVYVI